MPCTPIHLQLPANARWAKSSLRRQVVARSLEERPPLAQAENYSPVVAHKVVGYPQGARHRPAVSPLLAVSPLPAAFRRSVAQTAPAV